MNGLSLATATADDGIGIDGTMTRSSLLYVAAAMLEGGDGVRYVADGDFQSIENSSEAAQTWHHALAR